VASDSTPTQTSSRRKSSIRTVKGKDLIRAEKSALESTIVNGLATAAGVVGAVTAVASWLNQRQFNNLGWYISSVLALGLINLSIRSWQKLKLERIVRDNRSNFANYLFLIPSDGGESFYSAWLHSLAKTAREENQPIYLTGVFASESFEGEQIAEEHRGGLATLEALKKLKDTQHFDGMFAILNDPENERTQELISRYHELFDGRLILLDMNLFKESKKYTFPKFYFVGSDEVKGGQSAAHLAHDYLTKVRRATKEKYRILLLEPHENSLKSSKWDAQRITSFRSRLSELVPAVEFESVTHCRYNRETTKRQLDSIELLDMSRREWLLSFDLIFASNDDSALAADEYLDENVGGCDCGDCDSPTSCPNRGPRIIGYDGSPAFVKTALSKSNSWLIGTIDVRQEVQAKRAIGLMSDLRNRFQNDFPDFLPLIDPIPLLVPVIYGPIVVGQGDSSPCDYRLLSED